MRSLCHTPFCPNHLNVNSKHCGTTVLRMKSLSYIHNHNTIITKTDDIEGRTALTQRSEQGKFGFPLCK
jgi:hypothetical protein